MPDVWNEPDRAQALGKERSSLEIVVNTIEELDAGLDDADDLLQMAVEEDDQETVDELVNDLGDLEKQLEKLEFRRMFSGEMDTQEHTLISKPVRAALKRKIGRICYCGCICVGARAVVLLLT